MSKMEEWKWQLFNSTNFHFSIFCVICYSIYCILIVMIKLIYCTYLPFTLPTGYVWRVHSILCSSTCHESKSRECMAIFENFVKVWYYNTLLTERSIAGFYWLELFSWLTFCLILFSSCASRNDMLEACDSRNLDLLQKEFPLQ